MSKEIEDHRLLNASHNETFSSIIDKHLSRRRVLQGGLGMAAASMLGGFGLAGLSGTANADSGKSTGTPAKTPLALAFESIKGSRTDAFVVPAGYTAHVLAPWGTPLNDKAPQWSESLAMTPEAQLNSIGMHHDGMHNFALSEDTASSNFLLVMNNEYIDQDALWAPKGGATNAESGKRPADEVRTEINAHGVTVVEVKKDAGGKWDVVSNSGYNRRYTSASEMVLSGPVAGSDYVKTAFSPDGTRTRGTNNNCANGYTPWGTYLTCEENWPGYFVKRSDRQSDDDRIGIETERGRYGWETTAGDASEVDGEFARFDNTPTADSADKDYRNEPRTFGYIVEIDPYTGEKAVKRTALGRFRHEGCWPGKLVEGEPVVFYSGHDSRNEYIYKFVSDARWEAADAHVPGADKNRLAIGDKYLDKGTLYVAQFSADGTGKWLKLTPDAVTKDGRTLAAALGLAADDLAGVIIHTADAADLMGATPMDRPEWGAVDPASGEVYMTLTNNSKRTEEGTAAAFTNDGKAIEEPGVGYKTAPTNAANPRGDNEAGQIIRWREAGDHTAFDWEIFVFGAAASDADNLSGLTEMNEFASPDGLYFDEREDEQGILWIQTDNGYAGVADATNDQLLAVVPAALQQAEGDAAVIGADNQAQLKRFAVGPNGCEVTGIFATPDRTALFVNIQHPGNWPQSVDATAETDGSVRPRAATVVIQREDGGQIGV
ncbi:MULTISPECIES: PhoX family protein [Cobetia]|uniref:PhoX family protein n=1 Tax=Cobetia TaxID=204286 RepID=UPI000985596C|nr:MULTISPECIES: PhoX family phosphatase [Cobetia]POR05786.1 dTDP-glucose 4,6-dehydratase [Cobetia sp. MM1IDA2H-1]